MKRLISVLVLAFSFAAFAQGSTPAGDKPAAEKGEKKAHKGEKGEKAKKGDKKNGEKKPETAK